MKLSSIVCASFVALALTAGGALAATTITGAKSNADNKTSTGGTTAPDDSSLSRKMPGGTKYESSIQHIKLENEGAASQQNGCPGGAMVGNTGSPHYGQGIGSASKPCPTGNTKPGMKGPTRPPGLHW